MPEQFDHRLISTTEDHQAAILSFHYYLLVYLVFSVVGLVIGLPSAYGLGSIFGFSGRILLEMTPLFFSFLLGLLGIVLIKTRYVKTVLSIGQRVLRGLRPLGVINWGFWVILILFYGTSILYGINIPGFTSLPHTWLFGHIALLGALFLCAARSIKPIQSLLITFSIYGMILWVVYFVPDVTSYPLTLAWSESSHFYYASLIFSRSNYGQQQPLSFLNPSRYILLSLPFFVSSLSLWFHRFWQVLLWLGFTLASTLALTKRIKPNRFDFTLGVTAWFFLFCFQGPVYYQLMVVILIVLLGFKKDKLWQSLGFVAIASFWAGISRVNWFPVAGMLAVSLYVLESPYNGKTFWQYWCWPILAVIVGMLFAFSAQAMYVAFSGQNPAFYTLSFGMPLFGYRLLPNEAFGLGIIIWTLIAIFPVLVIIFWLILPRLNDWKSLRLLALLAILVALMVAGLVVSTRIGGGNNIHNMDSFLIILAVITAYVTFDRFIPDKVSVKQERVLPVPLVMLAFLVPLISVLNVLRPLPNLNEARAWADIQQVETVINDYRTDKSEILFIHQRHLLAFNVIENVELVAEYEKIELMEMAMASNEFYLNQFWEDLENHRFDLIISEPLRIVFRSSSDHFGEENNAWVTHVAIPLLESYEILSEMQSSNMVILRPRLGD